MERAARRNGEYARYADRRETEKKGLVCTTKKEVEWNGKCNPSAGRKKEREREGNMPRLQMQQRGRDGGREVPQIDRYRDD